jgi:hypothetical protein
VDDARFDALTRVLSSRRVAVGGIVGGVAALFGLAVPDEAIAHNPIPACRRIKDAARRRACLHRARAHNRKQHSCKPRPAAAFCGGRCGGTAINNCGKRVACPVCPTGKTCLSNGSCAQICPGPFAPGCPAGCECAADRENNTICFSGPVASCEAIPQICDNSAPCPPGSRCVFTECPSDPGPYRCYPLCAG